MPERYAWLTLVCVLCVLALGWCRAADEDEHVHIKVRMPEVARKHKSHKPSQQHTHHRYHYLPHQYYHNLHKPYHQPQLHAQYPHQAAKHGHRAVRPTPLTSPMMSHNHHDMGVYGDESPANDMSEYLLYSPGAPQPIPIDLTPNYGPALFGSSGSGSNNENIRQQGNNPSMSSMLTMPGGTQQLVQQMELMGALAAAAAAAAGGSANAEEDDSNSGGGVSETNTLLADDFLADLQSTYANGKYPTAGLRRKKKYRGAGLAEIGDAAATFALNSPQQQQQSIQLQQQQQLQLMRQQYQQQQKKQRQKQQQQFFGVNHFMQQAKPQAQMLRATPVISNSNNNNNYHNYRQHMAYKNKQQYNYNDIYSTATSDEDNDTDTDEVEDDGDTGGGDDDHDNADDFDDEVSLFFSRRPPPTTALSLTTTTHNTPNDYDDDVEQFGYNSHSMNNYFDGVEGDANVGVNSVSYQPTTAYGAYAVIPSTPATATQHKMRPYRQLQQQQHRYSATQPFGNSGHQQHHITTAQPINVVGPTASDFDDQQTPPTQPQPKQQQQQQQHHKYPMSTRYKKRKNRVKGKLNRNRILTQ